MVEEISRLVRTVIPNVFETMFFVFFEESEGQTPSPVTEARMEPALPWLQSEIAFRGNGYAGKIKLCLPQEMCRRLAADFIGTADEPIPEMQIRDMVGEIANMIAGNLFSHLDKKERYTISVPATELISCPHAPAGDRRLTFYFTCEMDRIRVDIEFDRETEPNSKTAHP
jgi:hypothetical protein